MPYKHLTDYERVIIHHLNLFHRSNAEIARQLKRSPSTISREIRRNANSMGQYLPGYAERLTHQRRLAAARRKRTGDAVLMAHVTKNGSELFYLLSCQVVSGYS